MRENWLNEIKEYVENQGTLVQDDNFDQVPVHHLTSPIKINGAYILYIGSDAIYSSNGRSFKYANMSDDEVYKIYLSL